MNTAGGDGGKGRRRAPRARAKPTARTSVAAAPRDCYVCVCSRPGSGATTPILLASRRVALRVGDVLAARTAGADRTAIATLAPIVPIGMCGLDVRERLHRFDANVHLPTRERGVSSANRVGEPVATLSMRWLPAPDGFEATPAAAVPDTEIRPDVSQRFVIQDGTLAFDDGGRGTIRFFGAGRTYPATTDGIPRLLIAATGVVLEGSGSLHGTSGTLMISGELTQPSTPALTIVARLDAGSPVSVVDALDPLRDMTGPDTLATVLTLVGDIDAGGVERLRVARIGNDIASAAGIRSFIRLGATVGSVRGRLSFDATDRRCAVPLVHASRELTFRDPAGVPVGTISIPTIEGTTVTGERDGRPISRLTAYGPATHGTGALSGAGGVLTLDTAVDAAGAAKTVYTLTIVDPGGRFRSTYSDAYKSTRGSWW